MDIGRKIIVVGSSGSGKSTFARRLHERTGLPLVHLDLIWWRPDATNISREEFDTALDKVLASDAWIIDGLYTRTLERRFAACDTCIFLDLPEEECLRGIEQRVGTKRPDIPWVEERVEPELVELVRDFHARKRATLLELFAQHPEKQVITFTSRAQADAWLDAPGDPEGDTTIHERITMDYQDINAETIDRWVEEGWEWGIPIGHDDYVRAQAGDWDVVLTPRSRCLTNGSATCEARRCWAWRPAAASRCPSSRRWVRTARCWITRSVSLTASAWWRSTKATTSASSGRT